MTTSPMLVGITNPDPTELPDGVDRAVRTLVSAEQLGVHSVWTSQEWGADALTLLGLVAARTGSVRLGTAIVPMWTRHPFVLAQEALTLQAASQGRLSLGVGPSHPGFMEPLGIQYREVVAFVTEYLRVLTDLVRTRATDFRGTHFRVQAQVQVTGPPVPVLLSALGPKMLDVAGRFADGTVTFLASPGYLRQVVRPLIDESASRYSRPRPKVVAAVQVAITETPEKIRRMHKSRMAAYARLPAYRRLLAASQVAGPEDLLVAGTFRQIVDELEIFGEAGADEIILEPFTDHLPAHDLQWIREVVRYFRR